MLVGSIKKKQGQRERCIVGGTTSLIGMRMDG